MTRFLRAVRVLRVLGLALVVMVVSGCATLRLNHIVTGTECPTRDDCIRDLALDRQSEQIDIVFVVTPLLMDEKGKAPIGIPAFNSPFLYGDVELCVAKALREQFRNAKIVFDEKDAPIPFVKIKLNKIVSQGVIPAKGYMRIDYEITVNGKTLKTYAKTNTEFGWTVTGMTKKHYPLVCKILAKQVKEYLETGTIKAEE